MDVKIVLIGAGSAAFSLSLIRDLCLTPNLQGSHITFVDIDQTRLDGAFSLCSRFASEVGIQLNLEKTTDRRAALHEADFVINTALGAGHYRLREGWQIGRKHGYRLGGSLHVMHDEAFWVNFYQYRLFETFIQDILEICPNAWYLKVANPVFAGTTFIGRKYPQAKIVGLCHGYGGVYHIAHLLELEREGLTFEIPGVNHFVWLTHLYHNGQEVMPQFERWIAEKAPEYWNSCRPSDDAGPKPVDLYRRFGVFPIGDTATPGGGAWGWWYHVDAETEQRWREDPTGWYDGYFTWGEKNVAEIKRISEDQSIKVTDHYKPEKSGEVMIPLIEAIACDIPRVLIGNILNTGEFVPGIPKDIAVEIPTLVSRRGIQGIRTNGLPRPILAYIFRDRIAPIEMELEAYQRGSRELLLQLIMMDPWTKSVDQANQFLEEILALPYHREMREYYK